MERIKKIVATILLLALTLNIAHDLFPHVHTVHIPQLEQVVGHDHHHHDHHHHGHHHSEANGVLESLSTYLSSLFTHHQQHYHQEKEWPAVLKLLVFEDYVLDGVEVERLALDISLIPSHNLKSSIVSVNNERYSEGCTRATSLRGPPHA